MRAEIETRELVVWAPQKSLAEAKLVAKQEPFSRQPRKCFLGFSPGTTSTTLACPSTSHQGLRRHVGQCAHQ
jgi:fibrillarin-like rRNA methylase